MITWTSFSNDITIAKLYKAYKQAKATGINQYVTNKKGQVFVRVGYQGGKPTFYAGNTNHVVNVHKAIQAIISRRGI